MDIRASEAPKDGQLQRLSGGGQRLRARQRHQRKTRQEQQ
jgi:hypothetical protein